ncbi:MAG: helix-turn-helix domain-containing protein [Mesorhizobium sp.]|uniref:GlxA family transcriptional regulator n=1 Tax=Mesorhizobium sp. TaxID=1871066 RepID=UPI000FE84425|nr:helix-turn-helix domain-containing protein [Mesorhizobium sp.]RWD52285.1 MAG: helix-turn-helix domain-containing protein [Mesorhizobium sp.]RWE61944.1 MAG: helix-turn-helix domain-containing protein [Mesorhizobium sp.]RWF12110.1 MAG: helix-turn-helix domain-containing protein [Mesorhizobium sp.]RWF22401.1 MAG: helix-turn-helix domain-containing protein [Mesorhizobium sp.]TIY06958.1 MAG: helix-turn-helix domain-containing protein [Mesorhizobium sp.]
MADQHHNPAQKPVPIDVVLADGFSMLTTTLILEALRFVNLAHRRMAFNWTIKGIQSESPRASNGFTLAAQQQFDSDTPPAEIIFLNASYFPDTAGSPRLSAWLRAAERHGAWILAVDTAPLLLAEAGLLTNRVATVHWEEFAGAQVRFPQVGFRTTSVEQSGRIITCSGGMAVLDMMLRLVTLHQGEAVAQHVRECFFLKDAETSLFVRDRKLSLAVELMRQFTESPLPLNDIAARSHMSMRQLQRRFEAEFGVAPGRFYTALRLQKGQSLLVNTRYPVAKVAFACGYASASHFSQAYRSFFGVTPHEERARLAAGQAQSRNRLAMFFQPSSSLLVDVHGPRLTP